jgi:primosomal protein N' (replication factor Y)
VVTARARGEPAPAPPAPGEPPRFAEIAVPVPLRRTFTYAVPEPLRGSVRPGAVVSVSFGHRRLHGFVVGLPDRADGFDLKDVLEVEDEEFSVPPAVLELTRWVADYYLAPWGEVLRAAMPAGLGRRTPGEVPTAEGTAPALTLNRAQGAALDAVTGALREGRSTTYLLHGVTGSGKTEVYLRAASAAVERGGKAIVLVPEIALSPQMVRRVESRFGHRVALWHSALTPTRRRSVWSRMRRGEIDVLVGARSAVFAPLPDVSLLVVDEEHESTYKQAESPRYHARDVALVRARAAGAVAILGSATPSLESTANARAGKYVLLELPDRVENRGVNPVEIVPLPRKPRPSASDPAPAIPVSAIFTDRLREELAAVLSHDEQGILFLNRRGHSTVVQCDSCRTAVACANCDIVLTYHAPENRLRCHYCGVSRTVPEWCPEAGCGGAVTVFRGVGTQKVESELHRLYPAARVLRLDTDVARKRGVLESTLETFRNREADILLGTQMVAKGLDFPGVTLVGVINADTQLTLPDFRSPERTFQLLTQVAGRAGRGDRPGRVIFQTNHPDHYALVAAAAQDYASFYREEMRRRADEVAYPPHTRLINLLFDGPEEAAVIRDAERAAAAMAALSEVHGGAVELLGPAPQPISRLKNQHRWHITLRGRDRRALRSVAEEALDHHDRSRSRIRLAVDVDPVSLL